MTASALLHLSVVLIILLMRPSLVTPPAGAALEPVEMTHAPPPRLVFFATLDPAGGGGGGGGNRQRDPIRRAQGKGRDAQTVRIAKPAVVTERRVDEGAVVTLPSLLLDARPLASGAFDQIGLPEGGITTGASTGPGSGGGVGTGIGTGIGPGRGPGLGPGAEGGTEGGTYQPGGAVTTPRLLSEVKPTYTNAALSAKIQGSVWLEVVVTKEGRPTGIRVMRSLDPGGLDEQAIAAVRQWRFEPGRLAGQAVNVSVTVVLDFQIR